MSTHLTGPLLNNSKATGTREWYSLLPMQEDPDYVIVRDDFLKVPATTSTPIAWTVISDASASTAVKADTSNGVVRLLSQATTDDSGSSIQSVDENILPEAGKKIWFETMLSGSTVAQMEFFAGLSNNFTTDPEAVLAANTLCGFQLVDGSAALKAVSTSGTDTTTTSAIATLTDNTFVKLGMLIDGVSSVKFFVDRSLVATHTLGVPTEECAISFYQISGDANGTRELDIDYVQVIKNR